MVGQQGLFTPVTHSGQQLPTSNMPVLNSQQIFNQASQSSAMMDPQIQEFLNGPKRAEIEMLLSKTLDNSSIILWSKPKNSISKSSRGSKFRGVSKNGKKWQVQLLGNLQKRYIGSITSEANAARIYDKYAIMTHGLKAKTNYSYTKS